MSGETKDASGREKREVKRSAGRLHRAHESKRDIRIHDYHDANHAIPRSMFRKRLATYLQMGYAVKTADGEGTELFS